MDEIGASSLRGVLARQPAAEIRFREAEALAKSLFVHNTPIPDFTEHGDRYSQEVEKHLDGLIFAEGQTGHIRLDLNPEEAMYLLSAAWLHDIGMMYGIFEGEQQIDGGDEQLIRKLRDEHDVRTARYINTMWRLRCSWSASERDLLSNLCFFHNPRHPIEALDPSVVIGGQSGQPIRLRQLATLLRVAVVALGVCPLSREKDRELVPERLLLRLYTRELAKDEDIVDAFISLYRAINAYDILCGGSGLTIDDWQIHVRQAERTGVLT